MTNRRSTPRPPETVPAKTKPGRLAPPHRPRDEPAPKVARAADPDGDLDRARRLGHRAVPAAADASRDPLGRDAVRRAAAKDADEEEKIGKGSKDVPGPRLALEEYLERRRDGRY